MRTLICAAILFAASSAFAQKAPEKAKQNLCPALQGIYHECVQTDGDSGRMTLDDRVVVTVTVDPETGIPAYTFAAEEHGEMNGKLAEFVADGNPHVTIANDEDGTERISRTVSCEGGWLKIAEFSTIKLNKNSEILTMNPRAQRVIRSSVRTLQGFDGDDFVTKVYLPADSEKPTNVARCKRIQ